MYFDKIQISGSTLASILQRFSCSPGDIEGILFGHSKQIKTDNLEDENETQNTTEIYIATITSFITGNIKEIKNEENSESVIGWFSGRRRSQLRPSLRESAVTASVAGDIFLLLTSPTPSEDRNNDEIHRHEYKAYQFAGKFVPKTLEVVNIGPAFRRHYGSFSPTSPFPILPCDFRGGSTSMNEDRNVEDGENKEGGMGLDVGRMTRLMGPRAGEYTEQVEELYKGMLDRLEQLAMLVDSSSSRVFDQENHNMKLRFKDAGLE